MALLEFDDVSVTYRSRGADVPAVRNVTLSVDAGESLGIAGESGCGKSTLARQLTMIEPATSGALEIRGVDVARADAATVKAMTVDQVRQTGADIILGNTYHLMLRPGEALIGQGDERQLALAPSKLQNFIRAVRETYDKMAANGEQPVLLTSPGNRPYVRSIIERFRPSTVVISQNEIFSKARIKTLGQL